MSRGPRGEKRPADAIGAAVMVAKIATGEIEDKGHTAPGRRKSGKAGAKARMGSLTAEQRSAIAKTAAAARWKEGSLKMMASERETLLDRFQAMTAENGLRDMKFFLGKVSETTVEAVCEVVNKVYHLVESGDFKEVNTWCESNRPGDT